MSHGRAHIVEDLCGAHGVLPVDQVIGVLHVDAQDISRFLYRQVALSSRWLNDRPMKILNLHHLIIPTKFCVGWTLGRRQAVSLSCLR